MTHSATLLLLDALAVIRLTRLVIADELTAPLRARLLGQRPATTRDLGGERILVVARPRLATFLSCPWCVSFWIAIGVVLMQAISPTACLYVTAVLAFSALAGFMLERG
jgi:hypothetical protein